MTVPAVFLPVPAVSTAFADMGVPPGCRMPDPGCDNAGAEPDNAKPYSNAAQYC
jgi:hypothetical protein